MQVNTSPLNRNQLRSPIGSANETVTGGTATRTNPSSPRPAVRPFHNPCGSRPRPLHFGLASKVRPPAVDSHCCRRGSPSRPLFARRSFAAPIPPHAREVQTPPPSRSVCPGFRGQGEMPALAATAAAGPSPRVFEEARSFDKDGGRRVVHTASRVQTFLRLQEGVPCVVPCGTKRASCGILRKHHARRGLGRHGGRQSRRSFRALSAAVRWASIPWKGTGKSWTESGRRVVGSAAGGKLGELWREERGPSAILAFGQIVRQAREGIGCRAAARGSPRFLRAIEVFCGTHRVDRVQPEEGRLPASRAEDVLCDDSEYNFSSLRYGRFRTSRCTRCQVTDHRKWRFGRTMGVT